MFYMPTRMLFGCRGVCCIFFDLAMYFFLCRKPEIYRYFSSKLTDLLHERSIRILRHLISFSLMYSHLYKLH